jgi:hypothetical protein
MRDAYFNTHSKSTNVRIQIAGQRAIRTWAQFLWHWAPGLTRWLALRLFFSPASHRMHADEAACLSQGRPFHLRVHDKTLAAWRWGHGPAVLLVHGWNGRGVQFHRFVAALVKAGYTAIAVDMPAHGASSGRITSYFEFTDTLRVLLSKELGLNIEGIIAHSFGAAAAINALAKEGVALNAVCLAPILKLQELLHNTLERYGLPHSLYVALISEFEKRFGYNLEADNPHRLVGDLRGSVLIVHDESDRTAIFEDSAEQARKHGHITLLATQGLGHKRLLTDETVVQVCVDHIRPLKPCVQDNLNRLNRRKERKLEPIQSLLQDYAAADEERRLSMFLTHRDLRALFTRIEMTPVLRPEMAPSAQACELPHCCKSRRASEPRRPRVTP